MLTAVETCWPRRIALGCAALISVFALVGCDPAPVPESTDAARMSVVLDATGGAEVQLFVGGDPARDRLLALGHDLDAVFPTGKPSDPKIDSNGGGFPFVTLSFAHVYQPGSQPLLHLDTQTAATALGLAGIANLDIDVSAPYVRTSAAWNVDPSSTDRGSWSWSSVSTSSRPVGTLQLHPNPGFGRFELYLVAIVAIALGSGFAFRRAGRPRVAIICGAVATLSGLAPIPTAGFAQMQNLGVSGDIGEPVLRYLQWLPFAAVVGACAGVVLVVVTATNPRKNASAANVHDQYS